MLYPVSFVITRVNERRPDCREYKERKSGKHMFFADSDKGGWCWGEYVTVGAGFTTAGVAAGSVAAAIQSAVYGGTVTAGSVFATLQSAGVGSFGAGEATYVKNKLPPCEQESKCSSDQE